MRLEDYTPERMCNALGVGAFAESWRRGLPARRLRLLLAPSFNREVCITLSEDEGGQLTVEVAAARQQFWQNGFDVGTDIERSQINSESFDRFEAMLRDNLPVGRRRGITIDGIPTYLAYRSLQAQIELKVNPSPDEPFGALVSEVCALAARLSETGPIQNALSSAWYTSKSD